MQFILNLKPEHVGIFAGTFQWTRHNHISITITLEKARNITFLHLMVHVDTQPKVKFHFMLSSTSNS